MPMACRALLQPYDPVTAARVSIRVCSANDPGATGGDGNTWQPAMVESPTLTMRLWNGDFTAAISTGTASLGIAMGVLREAALGADRCVWGAAPVEVWYGDTANPASWQKVFVGKTTGYSRASDVLSLTAEVDTEPFAANVLNLTYAGTGGAEGGTDIKGRAKPLVIGWARNVEPVLINAVDNVWQFSGYGAIEAVSALYERGSDFGASVGDYASYAALVGATIPAGRWATCLAQGMVRLGAPAYGVITGDVRGHKVGGATPRLTGAIVSALATIAGVSGGLINATTLSALDAAVPYNVNLVLQDQVEFIEVARRMALGCNWQAGISLQGILFVNTPSLSGSAALTINADGSTLPQVMTSEEMDVSPPYWRTIMGAERCWRVHSSDEIAYAANLVPSGPYSGSTTYREGNIVERPDGSTWVYINASPGSGNAPPTWPTTSNAYWSNVTPPLTAQGIAYTDGTPIENLKPAAAGADVTSANTAAAIAGQGALATANSASWSTQVSSRPTELTDGRVSAGLTSGGVVQSGKAETSSIASAAVSAAGYTSSSTVLNFVAATKTLVLSESFTKAENSSFIHVHTQIPMFGNDSVDAYIYIELWQSGSMVSQRQFQTEIDSNGNTYQAFHWQHIFSGFNAGTYEVRTYVERYTAKTCSTNGTYHMLRQEFKR